MTFSKVLQKQRNNYSRVVLPSKNIHIIGLVKQILVTLFSNLYEEIIKYWSHNLNRTNSLKLVVYYNIYLQIQKCILKTIV